jgi:hypothetical protein
VSGAVAGGSDERLVRQRAGSYRTADGRFTLENDGGSWFLMDTEQTDELGQPLIGGPFASLAQARAGIETARSAPPRRASLPKGPRSSAGEKKRPRDRGPREAAPVVETWLDRLPPEERTRTRRMIAALERLGVPDAEEVVRADRGFIPAVARRLIQHSLDAELGGEPEPAVRDALRTAFEILTERGIRPERDLPGWALVELPPGETPPGRRIVLGD